MSNKTSAVGGTKAKAYINEIGLTRVLAILAVLIVHSTSKVEVMLGADSIMFPVYNYINVLSKIGTTTFIFLSAFVLFYTYADRKLDRSFYFSFYTKRIKYILIPYVIFSAVYFVVPRIHSGTIYDMDWPMAVRFFDLLAEGKVYPHLYFVFVNVQFYLLFPILLWIFQKKPGWVKHTLWAGFVLQWGYIFLNQYYIGYPNKGSVAFSYMSHYFLGIFAAVYYDRFMLWLKSGWKWLVWFGFLAAGSVNAVMWILQRQGTHQFNLRLLDLVWCLHTIFAALLLLQLSFWLYARLNRTVLAWLLNLGACSFGVYLLHPLILFYYRRLTDTSDSLLYHLSLPGAFLTALLVSWTVIYLTARYIPGSWAIVGQVPSFKKRSRKPDTIRNSPSA